MASRDQQYNQNRNLFDVTPARLQPRATSQAPVLFGLPNLKKVETSDDRRSMGPPAAVAAGLAQASMPHSYTSNHTPTSPAQKAGNLGQTQGKGGQTSASDASQIARQGERASVATPVAVEPSYRPVPESKVSDKPSERMLMPTPFLGGWMNRLIVLGAIGIIVFYGWRSMPNVRRDVAKEVLEQQGLADARLETEVELPPQDKVESQNSVTRLAQAPSVTPPPFSTLDTNKPSVDSKTPDYSISLETPANRNATASDQTKPNANAFHLGLDSPSTEAGSSMPTNGEGFNFDSDGSRNRANQASDDWMSPTSMNSDQGGGSNVDLTPPSLMNSQSMQSGTSSQGSPYAENAAARPDGTGMTGETYSTPANTTVSNRPTIAETDYPNLSTEQYLESRRRYLAEQNARNNLVSNPGFAYPANGMQPNNAQLNNSQPNNASSSNFPASNVPSNNTPMAPNSFNAPQGGPGAGLLQGQAYPANSQGPAANRVVMPNNGPVGPVVKPYQPVYGNNVPSPPAGYGLPMGSNPPNPGLAPTSTNNGSTGVYGTRMNPEAALGQPTNPPQVKLPPYSPVGTNMGSNPIGPPMNR